MGACVQCVAAIIKDGRSFELELSYNSLQVLRRKLVKDGYLQREDYPESGKHLSKARVWGKCYRCNRPVDGELCQKCDVRRVSKAAKVA
jgi:predicted metal-binding protein